MPGDEVSLPGPPGLEAQPRLSAARPLCSNRPRFPYLEVDCTAWDRKKVQVQIRFLRPTQRALWAQRLLRGRGGGAVLLPDSKRDF